MAKILAATGRLPVGSSGSYQYPSWFDRYLHKTLKDSLKVRVSQIERFVRWKLRDECSNKNSNAQSWLLQSWLFERSRSLTTSFNIYLFHTMKYLAILISFPLEMPLLRWKSSTGRERQLDSALEFLSLSFQKEPPRDSLVAILERRSELDRSEPGIQRLLAWENRHLHKRVGTVYARGYCLLESAQDTVLKTVKCQARKRQKEESKYF